MLFIFVMHIVSVLATTPPQCEQAPAHAQPADSHYRLGVAGEPDVFLPGELYTVSLQGIDSGQGPTPFVGFTIWAEMFKDFAKNENNENVQPTSPSKPSLGTFQAYDAQTKLVEFCAPAVDNATAHPKTEVQVIWNAPLNLMEGCIRLCARIGSIDGAKTSSVLARKMCSTPSTPASFTRQPPIVEPCCACDEAKYEVTFEGLWSRNTHPREFPPESARAHFGDVIGASHTVQYRVWQEGRVASTGLRRLADDGATTALEKELKAESDHIRTIIKARGISWQQVAGMSNPSTFAVFRVDARHHLVSLAAKLAPSPDWIVGVSALELCNVNCTWRTSITVPLYPYDAGTDSGLSYTVLRQLLDACISVRVLAPVLSDRTLGDINKCLCIELTCPHGSCGQKNIEEGNSRRVPTIPAAPVRALRPDWPRDVRSPFFSTNSEMRAFARVRLTRLRLYEKSCDTSEPGADQLLEPGGLGGACATHEWGHWGPCSVTCGPGRASRQRQYVWPARAYAEACRVPLTDYRKCNGPRLHCRAISEYEPDPAESTGPCAVSVWSNWSPCEGCGIRARTRHYLVPRAHKKCHVGFRARTIMHQALPCDAGPCQKPPSSHANSTNFDWFFMDISRGECPVTQWGDWSPCSARCGRGRRLRTRLYTSRDTRVQKQLTRRLLYKWNKRFAELQAIEFPNENLTTVDPEVETLVQEHLERCEFTLTQQEALCDGQEGTCLNDTVSKEVCKKAMSVGHCRGYEERWFFDWASGVCEPFGFTGCGGNANNFRNRDHCQRACGNVKNSTIEKTTIAPIETTSKKMKPTPSSNDNDVMQNDTPSLQVVDTSSCEIGPWLGWSNCFGNCNLAVKLNYRLVMEKRITNSQSCKKLVKSRPCRPHHCRNLVLTSTDSTISVSANRSLEVEN